jgi:MFS family permease
VLTTVAGFLFLRLIHGFSTGFKPTATAAYVADLVPENKWGEAMGVHGICFSTGLAIGPAIGSTITDHFSIDVLFYCSSVFALMSIAILANMKESLKEKQRFSFSLLKIKRKDIVEWKVIPAALITLLSYVSYGAILTVIGDWSKYLGTNNKGLFFMVFTLTSLLIRFVAGKASDQYGRVLILKVSLGMLAASLVWIGLSASSFSLMAASALYGVATGMLSPAVSAWTIDLSDPGHRGKAVATMYIALEAGIGMGALLAGWLFVDDISTIPITFFICTGITLIALFYLQFGWKAKEAVV